METEQVSTPGCRVEPYYQDQHVRLFHGDCRGVLPQLAGYVLPDSCVTDPPYEETSAVWDVWPDGWIQAVGSVLPVPASLWCFGSARMWLDHGHEFRAAGWRFAQDMLWVKRNGTGPVNRSRLVKVHEGAYQWYRGQWGDLHHAWERVPYDGPDKSVHRTEQPAHHGRHQASTYVDDGTRQPRSVTYVIEAPSVRYQRRHQDEKPLATVIPLVRECTPPGGVVLDCFAGSGTTGIAARMLGVSCVLIERDEASCEVAARRLAEEALPVLVGVAR